MRLIVLLLALASVALCQTAQYPTAIASDQQMAVAKDTSRSTLSSAIDSSTLTVPVADGTKFAEKQIVLCGTEQMQICTISGNTLTICTGARGFNGTVAASHSSAAAIIGVISSWYHNVAREEIQAIQTALGASLAHPLNKGTTLPATCTVGDTYFDTDASAGENLYGCTAEDTWTVQSGGGGSATALTQATEFDTEGAIPVSAGATGRATEQSTWRVNPSTGALESTSTASGSLTGKHQTGTLAEPAAGYTNLGFKVTTGLPVYRVNGGSETTVATTAATTRNIGCAVGDPAGDALATGVLCYVTSPVACTITAWDILVDSGTATVDVWKVASGTAIPTNTETITAASEPAIASGTAIHSTTLTKWTTSVAKDDILGFNLDATSGPKYIAVTVQCQP
jgi:hypothetical protein